MSVPGKPRSVVRQPREVARDSDVFHAATCGSLEWLSLSLKRAQKPLHTDKHGLSVLHIASLYGHLECMKLLLNAGDVVDVNAVCPRGRRPIHMVLTAQSRPNTHACLTYLLDHEAQTNVTDEGLSPLHLAAAEGLRDCTETLVRNKADTHARDNRGHTALDLARIWGHRSIARFLKDAMWKKDKEQEKVKHKQLHQLRQDLLTMTESREKMVRLCVKKQTRRQRPINVKQTPRHAFCQPAELESTDDPRKCHPGKQTENCSISTITSKPPPGSIGRSRGVPSATNLHHSVRLDCWKDGRSRYMASWDGVEHSLPDLPLNDLLKGLLPYAFPSRIESPLDFQSSSVLDVPRLGRTLKPDGSPWTEVAMHLTEEFQPGHY
ncbi:ankyrin repeat domain-containing protein 53 isoform X2 [Triplophysa dalaica]|uniref:ankyrin repeat domain-containing protein 53 isoform X2 n=1 Tax=Triplophysa dalaica TaxID=1582913 RepID=UPI0024E02A75|nr:ankyrin repeat domain-containing protein 53 isoform X2 [Triplophysa dalaica]